MNSSSAFHGFIYLLTGVTYNLTALGLIGVSAAGIITTVRKSRSQSVSNHGLNTRIKTIMYSGIITFLFLQILYHSFAVAAFLFMGVERAIAGGEMTRFSFGAFVFWLSNCLNLISQYFVLLFSTYVSVEMVIKCVQENIFSDFVAKVYALVVGSGHVLFTTFCLFPLLIINLIYLVQNDSIFFPRDSTSTFYVFMYWKQTFNVLLLIGGVALGVLVTIVLGSTILTKIKEYALTAESTLNTEDEQQRFEAADDEDEDNLNLTMDERALKTGVISMIKINAYLVILLLVFMLHVIFYHYALFNNQSFSLLDVDLTNYAFEKGTAIAVMIGLLVQLKPDRSALSRLVKAFPSMVKNKTLEYDFEDTEHDKHDATEEFIA